MNAADPHHAQPVLALGAEIANARAAMILLHGRGASADDILGLAEHFMRDDVAYLAPDAAGHTWYPYPFIQPVERNEPYLSSALKLVDTIVQSIEAQGIPAERIIILGFSQGACLSTEYATRNARRYGGVAALTGGLIGAEVNQANYRGDFAGTPVLLGSSDVDPHIPLARVHETKAVMESLGAAVDERIYPGMPHTVNGDEVAWVKALLEVVAAG